MIVHFTVNNWKKAVRVASRLYTPKTCLVKYKRDGLLRAYLCMHRKKQQLTSYLKVVANNLLAGMRSRIM